MDGHYVSFIQQDLLNFFQEIAEDWLGIGHLNVDHIELGGKLRMRHDGRKAWSFVNWSSNNVFKYPEGSVVIRFGDTTVICSATVEDSVPPF